MKATAQIHAAQARPAYSVASAARLRIPVVDVRAHGGKTACAIAGDLNKDAVPTAQGEARVRTLLMWEGGH
jgi:hypothetical protein